MTSAHLYRDDAIVMKGAFPHYSILLCVVYAVVRLQRERLGWLTFQVLIHLNLTSSMQ
jgi:hypothetical protein